MHKNSTVYVQRTSRITEPNGTVVFEMENVLVPESWSQTATDIMAQKYFRKKGVPSDTVRVFEEGIPEAYLPSQPSSDATFGTETSAKNVFHRLAGAWTYWGIRFGHISVSQADDFYHKTFNALENQEFAPNSPQWFNTGLHWAYGIEGESQGHFHQDLTNQDTVTEATNAFGRPQASACFIQGIEDNLVGESGIMDTWIKEARLFKYGSGSGTNFSNIRGRGETLAGGGVSSGLMSFLKVGDVTAGSIKSGGTTRRAAKMVSLDIDHPDIEEFIDWKLKEENKVAMLAAGSDQISDYLERAIDTFGTEDFDEVNTQAIMDGVPDGYVERVILSLEQGINPDAERMGIDWQSEAYQTVSGQNSNNTIRLSDAFLDSVEQDEAWTLFNRTDHTPSKIVSAQELLRQACYATWACADPGIHYQDVIDTWHTCKADGEIRGSNPCSEYMFLDDTACNLASINLVKFLDDDGHFNIKAYKSLCMHITTILDITVGMAGYPTEKIAQGSINYRTLGLGFANLGGLLMRMGIPYDSEEGRYVGAILSSILTGSAYSQSALLAQSLGAFPRYKANEESMLEVIKLHRLAAHRQKNIKNDCMAIPNKYVQALAGAYTYQESIWKSAEILGGVYGFRNAQVSVAAPTGTIGLLMDCDTTGIEPDFALVKGKSLAGGGWMSIVNQGIEPALIQLGYDEEDVAIITNLILEGIPLEDIIKLKTEHRAVFHCANDIEASGHIEMLSVCQQFISGSMSKTINLPSTATVDDIQEIVLRSRDLGLKAISIYRDASKLSQPLSNSSKVKKLVAKPVEEKLEVVSPTPGTRRPLSNERNGHTVAFNVSGHKIHLRTGEYPDDSLGEIFIDMYKEGTLVSAVLNAFAISVSFGLQHGVPLQNYVNSFVHTKFEPNGMVMGHDNIKMCSSIMDVIFKHLAIRYLGRNDLAQVAPKEEDTPEVVSSVVAYVEEEEADYAGEPCSNCGSSELIRNGTCMLCKKCGTTTGCS